MVLFTYYLSLTAKSFCHYFEMGGYNEGLLFCLANKNSMTRLIFDRNVHRVLSVCGLDSKIYKELGFCIEAAILAAENNISDA